MVVELKNNIYIFEFKRDKSAQEALEQRLGSLGRQRRKRLGIGRRSLGQEALLDAEGAEMIEYLPTCV